jgi:hypothetical protein
MGPAHSFINPDNPFMRQSEGTPIELAETVHTHEIIISAVEAAKRVKAECGETPEGFINALREQHPEGVPVRVVDDYIKARKPKIEPAVTTGGLVITGGAASAGAIEEAPAPVRKSRIA